MLVDGVDVRDYPLEELRGKVGVVPQKAVLFQGTIRENLHVGQGGCNGRRDARRACRRSGP